jgi:hypothetical protein
LTRESTDIPPHIRERLTLPENSSAAVDAMKLFISEGNEAEFEEAVAIYCASARTREEPIETVLAVCCELAAGLEGPRQESDDVLSRPTKMHALIFAGILRAFYGDVAVERGIGASTQRKADASQHFKSGTWPKRPAE